MNQGSPGTDAGRAWWYAVLRTERERRLALASGRPITGPNLRRLLIRKLAAFAPQTCLAVQTGKHFDPMGEGKGGHVTNPTANQSFARAFAGLTGFPPLPWQERLYGDLVANKRLDRLDIPTGLGKTSIIPIWWLARHEQPELPRRLVYVVNRRTIVDQATDVAKKLRAQVGEKLLAVSPLRGALPDEGDWLLALHRPAIIVGTVDMIGSRLLFNGYRTGGWQRARHAGIIGHDTLIVHDEAHLSVPFQKLLIWAQKRQAAGPEALMRPLRVLAMSATAADESDEKPFTLNEADLQHDLVRRRLHSIKRLKLHAPAKKLAEQLAELAFVHNADRQRVIVFVRTPKTAAAVKKLLLAKIDDDARKIELLTGTLRGFERDELVQSRVLQHLLKSEQPEQTEYLISTSAGEVGADFDADHLVGDLTAIDSMVQRFGRVNRRGTGNATIDIVLDIEKSEKLKLYQQAAVNAGELLKKLPASKVGDDDGDSGIRDASPQALRDLKDTHPAEFAAAISPVPLDIQPHDATLDAWCLTSIRDSWPLAYEVAPFIHGLEENDAPRTTVAWRTELDDWFDPKLPLDLREQWLKTLLARYPLKPWETLKDSPADVADVIAAAGKRIAGQRSLPDDRPLFYVLARTGKTELRPLIDDIDPKRLVDELKDATVILPPSAGGLKDGIIDEKSAERVPDVADQRLPARMRVLLRRNEDDEYTLTVLGQTTQSVTHHESWKEARDHALDEIRVATPDGESEPRTAWQIIDRLDAVDSVGERTASLLLMRAKKKQDNHDAMLLDAHVQSVCKHADELAKLLPDETLRSAFAIAAKLHDEGKADPSWQRAAGNVDADGNIPSTRDKLVAKSGRQGMKSWLLNGYRHEFGSLLRALAPDHPDVQQTTGMARDLLLHWIATHHGRGRPHFDARANITPIDGLPHDLKPANITQRFARLQRAYGPWGLAWLEALFMAADAAGSQDPTDLEEEEQEADDVQP